MSLRLQRLRLATAAGSLALVAMLAAGRACAGEGDAGAGEREAPAAKAPRRHDQFGLVPEEPRDEELVLPDPVLDRTWQGPKPGEGAATREPIAPDEKEHDPFEDLDAPKPGAKGDGAKGNAGAGGAAAPRTRGLVGPDGHRDPGTPPPEIDPDLPDVLTRDAPDLDEMDKDEARPRSRPGLEDPYGGDPLEEDGAAPDEGAQ